MTQHDLDLMLAGDPVEAMEAAKRLIVAETMDPVGLSRIAADKKNKSGGRVAAIYALGFLDDAAVARPVLADILADPSDDEECRAHAAEALGHVGEPPIVPLMQKILHRDDSLEVKRWCVYALSEIGGAKARSALKKFAATNPRGKLAEELRLALSRH
jgi:HEAT repeat protein